MIKPTSFVLAIEKYNICDKRKQNLGKLSRKLIVCYFTDSDLTFQTELHN